LGRVSHFNPYRNRNPPARLIAVARPRAERIGGFGPLKAARCSSATSSARCGTQQLAVFRAAMPPYRELAMYYAVACVDRRAKAPASEPAAAPITRR
jgi:hypothetical protein